MSNRLPIPGGDNGSWGDILNAYLSVSHAADGTLNPGVVGTAQLQNNCVTNAQLDTPTQTAIAAVASRYTKPAGGIPGSDIATGTITGSNIANTTITDANISATAAITRTKLDSSTTTSLGKADTAVQLGGDLGGTSSAPTVAKLQGTTLNGGAPSDGQVLTYKSTGNQWVPSTVTSTTVSDATTSSKGIVELAGDLGGTAASPTVPSASGLRSATTSINVASATAPTNGQVLTASNSTTASWTTPAAGVTLDATSTDIVAGTTTGTGVAGSIGKAADAGHQHPLQAHDHTTTNKGGNIPVPTGLSATGTPSSSTYLRGDGSWSTPAAGVTLDATSTDIAPLGTQAAGAIGKAADAGHVHAMPTLNQVANPTTDVSLNSHKITSLANGSIGSDAAAFGQIPTTAAQVNAAQGLTPTAVKTSAYTAASGDFVPIDASGGTVGIALPSTPADKTRIGVKVVNQAATPNTVTITAGGTDRFNLATTGPTSITLAALYSGALLQYTASTGLWYVTALESPLNVASGAAKLGTDGTVGGPGGSQLTGSVVNASSVIIAVPAPTGNTTTDWSNIQNALNQANTASGGRVVLCSGTYEVSQTLNIYSNVSLDGAGKQVTTIQLASGSDTDLLITYDFYSLTGTNSGSGANSFLIRDLTLDHNGANQTNGWPLRIFGHGYDIDNVNILNGASGGAWVEGNESGSRIPEAHWRFVRIQDYIGGSSGPVYGLYWAGPQDAELTDIIIASLTSAEGSNKTSTTVYGLYIFSGAPLVTNMHIWGRNHYGVYPIGEGATFANCVAEGAFTANLVLFTRVTWVGGQIYGTNGNGGTQPNEVGIQLGDSLAYLSGTSTYGNTSTYVAKACSTAMVLGTWMNAFIDPGRPVNFNLDIGINIIHIVVNGSSLSALYSGGPASNSEYYILGWPLTYVQPAIATTGSKALTYSSTGLPGTTSVSRYAGATSAGAPTSGTFLVGDFVIDQTAKIWICTTAGSPGTWSQATGGVNTFNSRSGAVAPTSGDYTAAQVTNAADKSSALQQTFTGSVSAPAYVAAGLSGATSASRYVGATTAGAPTSGTFAVGDFVIDQSAKIWVCTTAGTPGTWTQLIATPKPHSSTHQLGGTDALTLTQYDKDNGQQGIYVPSPPYGYNAQPTAGRLYLVRFVPSRAMAIQSISFAVGVAANSNDQCDAGIYSGGTTPGLLGNAGMTSGMLNGLGVQYLTMSSTISLTAHTVYYAAFLYPSVGGTAAQLVCQALGSATGPGHNLFGATGGAAEVIMIGSQATLPPTVNPASSGGTPQPPILALREF